MSARRGRPEVVHCAYTELLDRLTLSGKHKKDLAARGVDRKAGRLGVKSLGLGGRARLVADMLASGKVTEEDLSFTPGFVIKEKSGKRFWTLSGSPGMLIPCRDHKGRILGLINRVDDPKNSGKYKWFSSRKAGGCSPGAPTNIPSHDGSWKVARLTEGILKCLVATHLGEIPCVGLASVSMWRRAARVLRQLKVKTVRVCYDMDARKNQTVARCLREQVRRLRRHGFEVQLETWDLDKAKGIDDALFSGTEIKLVIGDEEVDAEIGTIQEAANNASPPPGCPAPGPGPSAGGAGENDSPGCHLPDIQANKRQLRNITADVLQAIVRSNDPPTFFQRGGFFVRTIRDDEGQILLDTLDVHSIRGEIARRANFHHEKPGKDGGTRMEAVPPPMDVVRDLSSLPCWPEIPTCQGVTRVPVYSSTGRLLQQAGYDVESQLWYEPDEGLEIPPVPEAPTSQELERAVRFIVDDLLVDFPFADDACRANAVAMFLLHFVRQMIKGPTPFHLLDAPVEGTGKTLLFYALSILVLGIEHEVKTAPSQDDEVRKTISAALRTAPAFILLDNLAKTIDSAALASVLTSTRWSDRILGETRTLEVPNNTIWIGTGNNTQLSRELRRRTIWIRLDARLDDPWNRQGFKHNPLTSWVRDNRGQLIHAILTIIQAWIARGRPAGKESLGSFEAWAATMGGILEVAGITGLMKNAEKFHNKAADEVSEWREFVVNWWNKHQGEIVLASELLEIAIDRKLLSRVLGDKGDRSARVRFGIGLSKMEDRVINGLQILKSDKPDHSGRVLYFLRPMESTGAIESFEPSAPEPDTLEMSG